MWSLALALTAALCTLLRLRAPISVSLSLSFPNALYIHVPTARRTSLSVPQIRENVLRGIGVRKFAPANWKNRWKILEEQKVRSLARRSAMLIDLECTESQQSTMESFCRRVGEYRITLYSSCVHIVIPEQRTSNKLRAKSNRNYAILLAM